MFLLGVRLHGLFALLPIAKDKKAPTMALTMVSVLSLLGAGVNRLLTKLTLLSSTSSLYYLLPSTGERWKA